MKCDRRWYNDGRLDREVEVHWAEREAEERRRGGPRPVTFIWAPKGFRISLPKEPGEPHA